MKMAILTQEIKPLGGTFLYVAIDRSLINPRSRFATHYSPPDIQQM
jgi:hypothetical protein